MWMRSEFKGSLIPSGLLVHSPHIYRQTMVHIWHPHTNAKPKFITAIDHCLNPRHLFSNSVSALKTLTNSPPKFVQRLITTQSRLGKRRRSSVQDFSQESKNLRLAMPNLDWALLEQWLTLPGRKMSEYRCRFPII